GRYITRGYIVYAFGSGLLAQQFDPRSLSLSGQDVLTLSDSIEASSILEGPPFSVSSSGETLVYRGRASRGQRELGWYTREGIEAGTIGAQDRYWSARLSPDERLVAVEIEDPDTRANNIWIYNAATSARTRFTFSQTPDTGAVWSPDGQSIVFG